MEESNQLLKKYKSQPKEYLNSIQQNKILKVKNKLLKLKKDFRELKIEK